MKKLISFLLALTLLLSLAAPILPARAEAEPAQQVDTPDLKVGILSDIHVSTDYFGGVQPERWKHALQLYKTMDLDAIVVTGDLQESAGTSDTDIARQEAWMEIVVNTWYEVFPEKPGEDCVDIASNLVPLGDMCISLERAAAQAEEFGHSVEREVSYLTVHSVLHLLGYDHMDEGEEKRLMRSREELACEKLGMTR